SASRWWNGACWCGAPRPRKRGGNFLRHCERSEAIQDHTWGSGLLRRGACHRARIRATRWLLAMTVEKPSVQHLRIIRRLRRGLDRDRLDVAAVRLGAAMRGALRDYDQV